MKKIKHIEVKEFRLKGYLQELNRQFLHPLGLALSVNVKKNGDEILGPIWDYRDDDEGIYYNIKKLSPETMRKFKRKADFIYDEKAKKTIKRIRKLGFFVEPII